MNLKTIKFIAKTISWRALYKEPTWFFMYHLPFVLTCIVQSFNKPLHENLFFNTKIYDGMTRNDFIKGQLVSFLYKLGTIRRYYWEDDDGRGYFIGCLDDD